MKTKKTQRGFSLIEFDDLYGQHCSIQKSSLATEYAIWFGVDNTGDRIDGVNGKRNCENSRMHLNIKQLEFILPILQKFIKNGELPNTYKKLN